MLDPGNQTFTAGRNATLVIAPPAGGTTPRAFVINGLVDATTIAHEWCAHLRRCTGAAEGMGMQAARPDAYTAQRRYASSSDAIPCSFFTGTNSCADVAVVARVARSPCMIAG